MVLSHERKLDTWIHENIESLFGNWWQPFTMVTYLSFYTRYRTYQAMYTLSLCRTSSSDGRSYRTHVRIRKMWYIGNLGNAACTYTYTYTYITTNSPTIADEMEVVQTKRPRQQRAGGGDNERMHIGNERSLCRWSPGYSWEVWTSKLSAEERWQASRPLSSLGL